MRAISMKCPNCAAGLEASEAAHTITCKYCGTQSRIQHRTRFLERKVQMPPPPPAERRMPVAQQKHGLGWIVSIVTLLPLITGGAVLYTTMKQTGGLRKLSNAVSDVADTITGDSPMLYAGMGNALLHDVDGDGHRDVISLVRYVQNNDSYHLAAFDGLTGHKHWESERFGNHNDATAGTTALHHSTIVQSDSRGNISGFSAGDGVRLFKVSLGEKLAGLCADSKSSLAVHLKDKKWKSMDLATGEFTPLSGKPEGCARIATGEEHGQVDVDYSQDKRGHTRKVKVEGMKIRETVAFLNQPGRYVALGHKSSGTRVPMIAYFHDSKLDVPAEAPEQASSNKKKRRKTSRKKSHGPKYTVDWSSTLPALDPLGVKEGAPELVVANSQCVASVYVPKKDSPHVVCFDPVSGDRKWDSKLPKRTTYVVRALDITDDRVFVSQWSELDAFNISDGKRAFKVGH